MDTMVEDSYKCGGAKALVTLHEQYLREFLSVWRAADQQGVELPRVSDPDYQSRAALLAHVMGCAAGYLMWICEQLAFPRPEVERRPDPESLVDRADEYMEQVLAAWSRPLRDLTEERAYEPAHKSNWGSPYCIDAMLEHAVMHPVRHTHQLRRLMADGSTVT